MGELAPPGLEVLRPGEAAGVLLGGTLTQLLASLGTPFAFAPPAGHVLFIDEVGERPYRLDRMVTQLRQTGLLARAAAVVIGELPQCDEPVGRSDGARRDGRPVRRLSRTGPHRLSVRAHVGSGDDAAARRLVPRDRGDRRPRLVIEEAAVSVDEQRFISSASAARPWPRWRPC